MRFVSMICLLALLLSSMPATAQASAGSYKEPSPVTFTPEEVQDLLLAAPDAISSDVQEVSTADDLLRGVATLRIQQVDPNALEPDLRSTADKWNRLASSGWTMPTYEALRHAYSSDESFRSAVDDLVVVFTHCQSWVIFIVTVAVLFWPFTLILPITFCRNELPSVASTTTCVINRTLFAANTIGFVVNETIANCVPVAPKNVNFRRLPTP